MKSMILTELLTNSSTSGQEQNLEMSECGIQFLCHLLTCHKYLSACCWKLDNFENL